MPEIKSHPCFLTPKSLKPDYPLFVFFPGMDGTGQLLRSQTTDLEVGFDIRCLAIPPDDLTSWDILVARAIALIEAEIAKDSHRSVYVCGESFGACLAIKVAVRAPKLFERLILVNPASSFNRRAWLSWGAQLTQLVPECFYHFGSLVGLPFLAALDRICHSDRQALIDAVKMVPQKTAIWRLSLLQEFEVNNSELRRITQPVLLLAGAADRLLPSISEARHLVKVFPNAQTVILPNSGHACLLEKDVNLYKIMKSQKFLAGFNQSSENTSMSNQQPISSIA
jgi:pimeloyl-ACP methyl ester carboxylesterase